MKEALAEVSIMEVDKATPGDPKQRCKYCDVVVKQSFSADLFQVQGEGSFFQCMSKQEGGHQKQCSGHGGGEGGT